MATAACSGKTSSVCLSLPAGGAGGKAVTTGGTGYCLSIAQGATAGISTGGTVVMVCLEPIVGGAPVSAGAPAGGETGEAGETGEGGTTGDAGTTGEGGTTAGSGGLGGTPMICLTPPA